MYQLSEKSFALPPHSPRCLPDKPTPFSLTIVPPQIPYNCREMERGGGWRGGKNTGGGIRGYRPPLISPPTHTRTSVCVWGGGDTKEWL